MCQCEIERRTRTHTPSQRHARLTVVLITARRRMLIGGVRPCPEAQAAAAAKVLLPLQQPLGPLRLQPAELHAPRTWLISTLRLIYPAACCWLRTIQCGANLLQASAVVMGEHHACLEGHCCRVIAPVAAAAVGPCGQHLPKVRQQLRAAAALCDAVLHHLCHQPSYFPA